MKPIVLTALVLVGAAAVLAPSTFPADASVWSYQEWAWRLYLAIGNAAALGGAVLAVLLAWRAGHRAAPTLAASLAFAALAFGLGTSPGLPWPVPAPLLRATTLAAAVLAVLGFTRFASLYPRPFERGTATDAVLRSDRAQLPMTRLWTGLWAAVGGRVPAPVRVLGRRYRSWVDGPARRRADARAAAQAEARAGEAAGGAASGAAGEAARGARTTEARVEAFRDGTFAAFAERGWLIAGVLAAVSGVLAAASPEGLMPASLMVFLLVPVAAAWAMLRISYALGDEAERRQVLWIGEGFTLLIFVPGFLSYVFIVTMFIGDAPALALGALWPASLALGGALMVGCLAIAIFAAGALDPEATLRRTVVYGVLAVVMTLVFEAMENAASSYLVSMIGLPGDSAVWVSTGAAALTFGALHRRLERGAERALRSSESRASG